MNVKEIVDRTVQFFRDKKLDSPRLDAELLIARALELRRIDLYLKFDKPLGEDEITKCREVVRRRSAGEPVAYILGEKDFFGLNFQVDSRVLVPRPETELLAEAAVDFLKKTVTEPQVLDLGCGSGCLGLSVAVKIPAAQVKLVDLSAEALEVAKANATRLGVQDRCSWIQADASSVQLGDWEFDVILANPPYIAPQDPRLQDSVAKFEPHLALYAKDDGFDAISSWAKNALFSLKESGLIGFEFGQGQGPRAQELFQSLGLTDVRLIQDLAGHPRHVLGRKGVANG